MSIRPYRFFAHFNRINMQRSDPRVWTIHYRGVCHQVRDIEFRVTVETRYVPEGQQPRATLRGEAKSLLIRDGFAILE